MLEAMLNNKVPLDFSLSEDLLTSTVFGLLQYVPFYYWTEFLKTAVNINGASFLDACSDQGLDPNNLELIEVCFWKSYSGYGEPDIMVTLTSKESGASAAFAIEVKLDSQKSNSNNGDQLVRYLDLLQSTGFRESLQLANLHTLGVIYLTPRFAKAEIAESLEQLSDARADRSQLFHLQWQDVYESLCKTTSSGSHVVAAIAKKIAALLQKQGLTYFHGFSEAIIPEELKTFPLYTQAYFRELDFDYIRQIIKIY